MNGPCRRLGKTGLGARRSRVGAIGADRACARCGRPPAPAGPDLVFAARAFSSACAVAIAREGPLAPVLRIRSVIEIRYENARDRTPEEALDGRHFGTFLRAHQREGVP